MSNYDELSRKLVEAALAGNLQEEADEINSGNDEEQKEKLNKLLYPKENPLVVQLGSCGCSPDEASPCQVSCLFDAIKRDEQGKLIVTSECTGCGSCIEACKNHNLTGSKELVPILELLHDKKTPVYAMIAPAFSGQFSSEVTSGKLRSAFKCLGFYGMLEVSLFADILTLKEALEFDRSIHNDTDFLLTSCCCPMWVALIRKSYSDIIPHVPPSVSPMVACGRSIKRLHPDAKTVFIGPCIAKKAEARDADIADAVDYVLTFEEINGLFDIMKMDLTALPEEESDHSSTAGRIYARTGGVSEAVKATLAKLRPDRSIPLVAQQADGIIACKELLKEISEGNIKANFIEGMGCKGGCVGGPKVLINKESATQHVNDYGAAATSSTPIDNNYVLEMLHRLGFDTVESLLDRDNTFIRKL